MYNICIYIYTYIYMYASGCFCLKQSPPQGQQSRHIISIIVILTIFRDHSRYSRRNMESNCLTLKKTPKSARRLNSTHNIAMALNSEGLSQLRPQELRRISHRVEGKKVPQMGLIRLYIYITIVSLLYSCITIVCSTLV